MVAVISAVTTAQDFQTNNIGYLGVPPEAYNDGFVTVKAEGPWCRLKAVNYCAA